MKILIYTILVKEPRHYLPMLRLMWSSIDMFGALGPKSCEFLVIGNAHCLKEITTVERPAFISQLHAMEIPAEADLHDSLLRKLDIAEFSGVMSYDRVFYMDVDIIVQGPLRPLLESPKVEKGILYAARERKDFNHPFFGFGKYSAKEKRAMHKLGSRTFNDGTFLFEPCPEILAAFREIKAFANAKENEPLRKEIYDQSFLDRKSVV